jgi:beta-fructofuranosidase
MSWNHALSSDMLHWSHLPVALTPTPGIPDAYGCFSGSALQVSKRVYAVYTGTKKSTPEFATVRDGQNKIQESQCLAWSDDSKLMKWTKDPQPIVPLPPEGMKVTGFRDPSAWKQGEWYYITVASGVAEIGGCVLLYRSNDLKSWEYMHELTSGSWNAKSTANPCDDVEMWDCPKFFALDGRHVLIYSHVSYSAERHAFVVDGREIALEPSDVPMLHAFVDGSGARYPGAGERERGEDDGVEDCSDLAEPPHAPRI